jgi:hypothetical protein
VTVTNDGATILKLLEVEHPAGKILVELAQLQDEEVGDGTTSVVIIAAELLKAADELVKQKLHPTTVINGYRLACKEAVRYMQVCIFNYLFKIRSSILGELVIHNRRCGQRQLDPCGKDFNVVEIDRIVSLISPFKIYFRLLVTPTSLVSFALRPPSSSKLPTRTTK